MSPTLQPLQDDYILAARGSTAEQKTLDVMSSMIYRCATERKTIAQTVEAIGLDREIACRIIQQLLDSGIIAIANAGGNGRIIEGVPSQGAQKSSGQAEECRKDGDSTEDDLETLFSSCQTVNFYELLGIDPDTSRSEMRSRYFELSKRYHPDKAFGKANRDKKHKMSVVFQRLTEAYDTLSNPKRRAEYDASLGEQLELWAMESKLKRAMDTAEKREPIVPPAPPPSEVKSENNIESAFSASSVVSEARRAENIGKPNETSNANGAKVSDASERVSVGSGRLSGSRRTSHGTKFVPSVSPRARDKTRREAMRRKRAGQAMADILRRRSIKPPTSEKSLRDCLADASHALERGAYPEAIEKIDKALELFPKNAEAEKMLERATRLQERSVVQEHLRQGRYAKIAGEYDKAVWNYEQALAKDNNSLDARHFLAELYVEKRENMGRALSLMKEVIVLGGQRSRYFVTLGEIFLLLKELDRASDAFNKALKMEPNNIELKKRLKQCKQ